MFLLGIGAGLVADDVSEDEPPLLVEDDEGVIVFPFGGLNGGLESFGFCIIAVFIACGGRGSGWFIICGVMIVGLIVWALGFIMPIGIKVSGDSGIGIICDSCNVPSSIT